MDLSRIARMLGPDAPDALSLASVCVFGLGGVGSSAVEALVRSGIGRLGLVDFDVFIPSNINRQIPALPSTMGRLKAEVVRDRVLQINPACQVTILTERYLPGAFDRFWDPGYDGLIDAIDDVPAKVDLCVQAAERSLSFVCVMGTGCKLAPELLRVADISKTEGCPLARRVRKRLRSLGVRGGVRTVFSPEPPIRAESDTSVPGSMAFVPGAAGLMAASLIVRDMMTRADIL